MLASRRPALALVGEIKAAPAHGGIEIETQLDPKEQPFLYDHAPDPETPWLPGVMAIEALAEAASVLAPDHRVAAVENVRMLGAFKFFRMEPPHAVRLAVRSGPSFATCSLRWPYARSRSRSKPGCRRR